MKPIEIDVSIVIPCYNEAGHLRRSFEELDGIMSASKYTYEYILVDDASIDNTKEIVAQICGAYTNATPIYHDSNSGRGASVMDGLRSARGKYAGYLDIDLEVHARYLPSFLIALDRGADLAVGQRVYKIKISPIFIMRHLLSQSYKSLSVRLLDLPFADTECGYKFFNVGRMRPVLEQSRNRHWFWDTEVMALAHENRCAASEIPVLFIRNPEKKSTVRIIPDSISYLRELFQFKYRKGIYEKKPHI